MSDNKPVACVDCGLGKRPYSGLLCSNCNAGLAMFKDDPEVLVSAMRYLKDKTP